MKRNFKVTIMNQVQRFKKIFDQYAGFISLEGSLFSLGLRNCYVELNDNTAGEEQIMSAVNKVVDGLLSVLATLGVVPVIRCPSGGLAEHVAQRLDQKLKDHLKLRNSIFQDQGGPLGASLSRPLLVLFDRNFELSAALQHTWTYKPLVQDVLGLKLNKIDLPETQQKTFDVDDEDFFWQAHGGKAFPEIASEVDAALGEYKKAMDRINQKTGGQGNADQMSGDDDFNQNTKELMSAVSSIPELTARKRVIDKHTNIATALLNAIKARKLDEYYNVEEDILQGKADFAKVIKQLSAPQGTPTDKLRLALIYLLVTEETPAENQIVEMENALMASGANLASFSYVKRLRRMNLAGAKSYPNLQAAAASTAQTNLFNWADKTFQQGVSAMTKGVKNLLAGQRQSAIATALRMLLESKEDSSSSEAQFSFYDPKTRDSKPKPGTQFREAIVFVIGGGNYLERESLQTWAAKSQPQRHVVYGSTELLSGEDFLQQLEELGKKSGI
eukprot:TRINITY_DN8904_c0_g1_i2.p1 TRINITY_DN8904_c0_g1~~TRINITY_DN8904_c0_g1_i2.p1  ORF type:complete len:501 (-),score=62.95 TRINITY_DN8904_c0_g1_i2:656-2158(-)